MATIYKRTRRKPIPKGAEIVSRNGQQFALWTDRRTKRRHRAPLSDDGRVVIVQADCYTIEWFDHENKRRRKGTRIADKDAAQQLANKLETAAMQRTEGLLDATQERFAVEGRRPLGEHLADYEAKMKAAGRDQKHIATTIGYIRTTAETAGFATIAAITADGVNVYAGALRERWSARTVQAHLTAVKAFTRWLAQEGKPPADPLASVRRPNPKRDRRRERRMLLPEEWKWLRSVTLAEGVERYGMGAGERVLLYATAAQIGLRSGELRSLTRGRLFLDAEKPYVTCKAGSTKDSKDARQYIQASLAEELREHVSKKAPGAPVFGMPPREDVAGMLRADLADARRAWLKAAQYDPEERARREQSDFLLPVNHEGETLDFHGLRHTCGAWLAMTGAHPKAVQAVMRHSTITLTMDAYSHLFPGQEAEIVARLSDMLAKAPEAVQATGTDNATAESVAGNGQHQGQQLGGRLGRMLAKCGESEPRLHRPASDSEPLPQVLTRSRNDKRRPAVATAGERAEGMGLEPTTGKPAPDFESGC
jgi:integrase